MNEIERVKQVKSTMIKPDIMNS